MRKQVTYRGFAHTFQTVSHHVGDVAIKSIGKEIFERNSSIKNTPIFNIQIDSFLKYIFMPIEDLQGTAKLLVNPGPQLLIIQKSVITGENIKGGIVRGAYFISIFKIFPWESVKSKVSEIISTLKNNL